MALFVSTCELALGDIWIPMDGLEMKAILASCLWSPRVRLLEKIRTLESMDERLPIRYLIIGLQRSGTTVTHLLLRGHPNVAALNDELEVSPFFDQGLGVFTSSGASSAVEKRRGRLALFDALTSIEASAETRAVGLKVTPRTAQDAELVCDTIRDSMPGVRVIFTLRDDLVAQLGSRLRAEMTGQWHSWTERSRKAPDKIEIAAEAMATYVHECQRIIDHVRSLRSTHGFLELSYEREILEHAADGQRKLFVFLGLPVVSVDWLNSKKVSPAPREFIANYDGLARIVSELRE